MRHLGFGSSLDQIVRFATIAKVWHTSSCRLQGVVALEYVALGTFNIFQQFSHLHHLHLLTSGLNPPQRPLEHRFLPLWAAPEANLKHCSTHFPVTGQRRRPSLELVWAMVMLSKVASPQCTRPLRTPCQIGIHHICLPSYCDVDLAAFSLGVLVVVDVVLVVFAVVVFGNT